jgi:hypothetical protein
MTIILNKTISKYQIIAFNLFLLKNENKTELKNEKIVIYMFLTLRLCPTIKAHFSPSMAAEIMPPA